MATAIETTEAAEATSLMGEQRVLIRDVSYEFYKRLSDEIGEQPVRLSFTDDCLEIMNTLSPHEFYKTILAKLIEAIFYEFDLPVRSGGAMTMRHDKKKKGFEPDESWWIAHESEARAKTKFDFQYDSPPDLAIEIEMSRSLVSRIGIYAAIGIPEVWRFDGKKLRFCLLNEDGEYKDAETSLSFPFLKPADLMPYLAPPNDAVSETGRVKAFVKWLQAQNIK